MPAFVRHLLVLLATLVALAAGEARAQKCDDPAMPVHTGDGECMPLRAQYCGGGHFCVRGTVCRADGSCTHPDDVLCGGRTCAAGLICAADGQHCTAPLAPGRVDCGGGHSCPADKQCAPDGLQCILPGQFVCGESFCNAGDTCVAGRTCVPRGGSACGDGSFCPSGSTCTPTPAGMTCKRNPFAPRG